MKSWRSHGRRRSSLQQPLLPGLSGANGEKSSPKNKRRFSSPGEYALERARRRLSVVLLGFALIFTVISGRLATLTLGNETQEPEPVHALSAEVPVASRADIQDRNGTILATSLPTMTLTADSRKILDPEEAVKKLGALLPDLDKKKLLDELKDSKRFVMIRRRLVPRLVFEINRLGIGGLEFVPDESRIYPSGEVVAHVVGYTDIDNKGIAGLEKGLNERLEGSPEPIQTSLDIRLQTILHRELKEAMREFQALGAAGLIMDVHTGEILSLVSLPDFDPQTAGKASPNAKFNRATLGVYEMGSTFKMFNTAMALDSGLIKPAERFDTIHPIEIGGKTIKDFHPVKHWLNVAEIFMESSNIGSARMAERLGTARQKTFLSHLGLTQKPSLEIPEVGAPIVPSGASWRETTTMTISFGHGIAVNAVQLVAAASSLINDGVPLRPTLLKKNEAASEKRSEEDRVVSSRTSAQMRALMRLVVKEGTAKKAEVPGYIVGGKTGTADKLSGRKYSESARMSSFLGVFPAASPRYAVFVLLDDPKGNAKTYGFATGGWTAAPVVGKVISQIGPLVNLPPIEPDVMAATEHQLLRPLGAEVLESLKLRDEAEDYAAVESNRTH